MKNRFTALIMLCSTLIFFHCQSFEFIQLGSDVHHDEGRRILLGQDGHFLAAGDSKGAGNNFSNGYTLVNSIGVAGDSLSVRQSNFFTEEIQTPYQLGRKPNGLFYGVGTSRKTVFAQSDLRVALPRPHVSLYAVGDTLETKIYTGGLDFQWYYEGKLMPTEKARWILPVEQGNYTLRVSDPKGCAASSSFYWNAGVILESPPLFRAVPSPVCADRIVNFHSIVNDAASYYWDFGNGQTSDLQHPGNIRYPDTSQFPISLTIETFPGQQIIDEITFLSIPGFWGDPIFDPTPTLYIRIKDEDFNLKYTSRFQGGRPISTIPTSILLFPDQNYTLEVWEYDLLSNDDFLGSFTIQGGTSQANYQHDDLHLEINIGLAAPSYAYSYDIEVTRPIIVAVGDSLLADLPHLGVNSATRYQWYLNGEAIPGATNAFYQPQQSGEYSVKINQSSCLNTFSGPYYWNVTTTEEVPTPPKFNSIQIFPNPQQVGGIVRVSFLHPIAENGLVRLFDLSGRNISTREVALSNGENELSQVVPTDPGIYLIQIIGEGGHQYSGKVVVK